MDALKERDIESGQEADARAALIMMARSLRKKIEDEKNRPRRLSSFCMIGRSQAAAPAPRQGSDRQPLAETSALSLEAVRTELGDCQRCHLGQLRKNLVFGEGNPRAGIVFVGEAPGGDEDIQGRPFVGRAGQLLTKIIAAMKLSRRDVYICNILKCRPPENRSPRPDEIAACEPFLMKQLAAIKPAVICALGTIAARNLLKTEVPITALRGRFHSYQGIPVMPTYHPAYLLRNPEAKKQVWEDIRMIMKTMNLI